MQADGCLPVFISPESHSWPPRSEFCWLAFTYSTQCWRAGSHRETNHWNFVFCSSQQLKFTLLSQCQPFVKLWCPILPEERTSWLTLMGYWTLILRKNGWVGVSSFSQEVPSSRVKGANSPDICITKVGGSIQRIHFTIMKLCTWISYYLYLRTRTPLKHFLKLYLTRPPVPSWLRGMIS